MRKWTAIILTSMYLIGALGLHVQIHFCCGHLSALDWCPQFQHQDHHNTNCCQKSDCCTSLIIHADIDDEHTLAKNVLVESVGVLNQTHVPCPLELCFTEVGLHQGDLDYQGPPPYSGKERVCLLQGWKFDLMV